MFIKFTVEIDGGEVGSDEEELSENAAGIEERVATAPAM